MAAALVLAASLAAGVPALAEAPAPTQVAEDASGLLLSLVERQLIDGYYQRQHDEWSREAGSDKTKKKKKHGLPPGLAKKGTLPPGIYKQLVQNGALPPGLQWEPLPGELAAQLPARPANQQYYIADDKVLLVDAVSNLILDVLAVTAAEVE